MGELKKSNQGFDIVGRTSSADQFMRRVEWTIDSFAQKYQDIAKGSSIWSPKFRAAGMDGLQLEFFPKGREKTTYEGFCSLFLWCPSGTKIKYQLWVGNFLRAPDEDDYVGRIGHGHSNFCPLVPQCDMQKDSVTVGVDFLEVKSYMEDKTHKLKLHSSGIEAMVQREAEIIRNRNVNKVVWKIKKLSEKVNYFPRGTSMWSRPFAASGIQEILLEFYPNGSANTTKDGFCAFYIRCPEGVCMIVTLYVGKVRKGPIKTTFDGLTGKGLPDFCLLRDEMSVEDDSIEVGIELQNQPSKILMLET